MFLPGARSAGNAAPETRAKRVAGGGEAALSFWRLRNGPRSLTFKKRDLRTAVEAAHEAGLEVTRVEVDKDGKIDIAGKAAENGGAGNEWDEVDGKNQAAIRAKL